MATEQIDLSSMLARLYTLESTQVNCGKYNSNGGCLCDQCYWKNLQRFKLHWEGWSVWPFSTGLI